MSEKRKSALVGCTRTWALELAQFGISLLMVEEARENVRNVQKLCGNRQTPIQGCNLILSLLVRYFVSVKSLPPVIPVPGSLA
ncbi:TPA: hypothetical protein MIQ92_25115 [Klebsiella pneumoniae]|nr:hypothetical protein [Klebsiella pneumoniae]